VAKSVKKTKSRKRAAIAYIVQTSNGRFKVVLADKGSSPFHGKPAKYLQTPSHGRVSEQRVYDNHGRLKTVYTVDAASGTFGNDLRYAFKKNVSKARRENIKKFGSADPVLVKN
jgi:hypothetical protein